MPTINDDRNVNRNADLNGRTGWGTGHYMLGGLAVLAVIFGLMFMLGDRNSTVANRTDRPAVTTAPATTPATTTGSGAARSALPNNPNGTTPQKDINQPAPAPSPNR